MQERKYQFRKFRGGSGRRCGIRGAGSGARSRRCCSHNAMKGIWHDLGGGDKNNFHQDNFGWVNTITKIEALEGTRQWALEECKAMPYGHHQIGIFHL